MPSKKPSAPSPKPPAKLETIVCPPPAEPSSPAPAVEPPAPKHRSTAIGDPSEARRERIAVAALKGLCFAHPTAAPAYIAERAVEVADALLARLDAPADAVPRPARESLAERIAAEEALERR